MVKKLGWICLIVVAAVSFVACGTAKKIVGMSYSDLNGEWEVIEMNGKTLDPSVTNQTMVFDTYQNIVSGNAGCNRISGRIEHNAVQRHVIKFMQVVSTRMACIDMTLENEYLQTIDKVVRFESVYNESPVTSVALYGTDNSRLFVLRKK
ncbi:MAG: META domain-containing protein [Tannerellaceae bacterium]|nr:META domain-containing protein [Tannerellaceae bacterium]